MSLNYEQRMAQLSPEEQEKLGYHRTPEAQKYFGNSSDLVGKLYKLPADDQAAVDSNSTVDAMTSPTPTPAPVDPNAAANAQAAKYEKMLADIKAAQDEQMAQHTAIDMGRGANKIAEAIASGYGAKIGDASDISNALSKTADIPVENLLKQYKMQQQLQGQKNPWQLRTLTDADGKIRQYRINTLTGETAPVGEAGFALGGHFDKETGQYVTDKKTDINSPSIVKTVAQPEVAPQKEYAISDIQGKPEVYKETVLPKLAEFKKDMQDSRDVATAVTNLNAKVGVGANLDQIISSGNLGSVQTQAAKMAGQKGVLTDQDLVKFAGEGGVAAWINRFVSGAFGEMSEDDVKFFRKFSKIMSQSLANDIQNKSQFQADQIRKGVEKYLPGFTNENALKWLSADKVAPVVQGGGVGGDPTEQTVTIRHKATGETQKVKQSAAKKYLDKPDEFEQVQ